MSYLVVVCGDTNDADYVYSNVKISECDMDKYHPLLSKVAGVIGSSSTSSNWPNNEYCDETVYDKYVGQLTEEEINTFNSMFVPSGEIGIHTLESITVYKVASTEYVY